MMRLWAPGAERYLRDAEGKEVRPGGMICPSCRVGVGPLERTCPECGAAVPVAPGAVIAERFELLESLGAGGMGAVFKARDRQLQETVAVKVLRLDRDAHAVERFHSEVRLARKVKHRNVCGVYEYGEDGDVLFCAMELISGRNLRQLLLEAPLPRSRAYEIALAAAAGLQAIHEAGVIHRDVKSANVMIDAKGEIRLVDFGIAQRQQRRGDETPARGLTDVHHVVGSPEYMSPEQVKGRPLDPRSDVYSFGVVLYEMFTGHVPFKAETALGVMAKQLEEPPPLEGSVADLLPAELLPVLRKALAKEPGKRYASVAELARDLRAAQEAHARAGTDEMTLAEGGTRGRSSAPSDESSIATRWGGIPWQLPTAAVAALASLAVATAVYLGRSRPVAGEHERPRAMEEAATSASPSPFPSSSPTPGVRLPSSSPPPSPPAVMPEPRGRASPRATANTRLLVGRPTPTPTPAPTTAPLPAPSAPPSPSPAAAAPPALTSAPPPTPTPTPTPTPARVTPPTRHGDMLSADDPAVVPPRCVSCDVAYSPQAERLRAEGDVVLALVVDEAGRVAEARLVRSDDKVLEAPALRSVTKWRYHPATKGGVAGKIRIQVTVRFRL